MFAVQETPFDLRFQLARIPIRVIPTFWAVGLLLGWNPDQPNYMVIWMLVYFVSFLVHELGHALTAEAFGYESHIVLHHFGGHAAFQPPYRFPHWQNFLITIAGPSGDFILAGLTFAIGLALGCAFVVTPQWLVIAVSEHEYLNVALTYSIYINIWYGVFNLLPLLPLDGGRLLEATLGIFGIRNATDWTLKVSVATAILTALVAYKFQQQGIVIMMIVLLVMNVERLQQPRW